MPRWPASPPPAHPPPRPPHTHDATRGPRLLPSLSLTDRNPLARQRLDVDAAPDGLQQRPQAGDAHGGGRARALCVVCVCVCVRRGARGRARGPRERRARERKKSARQRVREKRACFYLSPCSTPHHPPPLRQPGKRMQCVRRLHRGGQKKQGAEEEKKKQAGMVLLFWSFFC